MDWLPTDAWRPATAPITTGSAYRAPAILDDIVDQFQVEKHPRYAPGDGKTWCATFAWDVSRALAAELPHWWLGKELTANTLADWLSVTGPSHGWHPTSAEDAQAAANIGRPAVAIWKNPGGGHGHVAVLVPSHGASGVVIAQAGASNFVRRPLADGFGNLPVLFYSHN